MAAAMFGLACAFAIGGTPVLAQTMRVMESRPAAHALMDATNTRFFVRFDGPVDHAASTLTVLQDGRLVQVLHPRLNSSPNTLYGSGARLKPGDYELRWTTRQMHGQQGLFGTIPFRVGGMHH